MKSKSGGDWDSKQFCQKADNDPCQNFGNYAWGMLAAAFGFELITTQRGAGLYQVWSGRSKWDWSHPVPVLPALSEPPYGDDPIDHYWVTRGWTDYSEMKEKP